MMNLSKRIFNNSLRSNLINACLSKFYFSQNSQRLSRHQAILASNIINLISTDSQKQINQLYQRSNTDQNKQIAQYTLRSRIINYIDKYSSQDNSEDINISKAKKQIRNIFTEGTLVNNMMIYHSKHNDIMSLDISSKIDENGAKLRKKLLNQQIDQLKSSYSKINFCPSYAVTGQVFRQIIDKQKTDNHDLVSGNQGVGKSLSALLYKVLSDYIHLYKYNYLINVQNPSQAITAKINFNFPKAIFWRIDLTKDKHKQFVVQKILAQCKELNEKQIRKQWSRYFFIKDFIGNIFCGVILRYYYWKIAKTCLIIDEIDALTDVIRNQNAVDVLAKKYLPNDTKLFQAQFKSKIHQKYTKHLTQVKSKDKINNFKKALFKSVESTYSISTASIQQPYYKPLYSTPTQNQLDLNVSRLKYAQKIKQISSVLDLVEFIILNYQTDSQLKNKLNQLFKISQDYNEIERDRLIINFIRSQFRTVLFQELIKRQYLIITPQSIRLYFKHYRTNKQLQKIGIKQLVKQIQDFSYRLMEKQFKGKFSNHPLFLKQGFKELKSRLFSAFSQQVQNKSDTDNSFCQIQINRLSSQQINLLDQFITRSYFQLQIHLSEQKVKIKSLLPTFLFKKLIISCIKSFTLNPQTQNNNQNSQTSKQSPSTSNQQNSKQK